MHNLLFSYIEFCKIQEGVINLRITYRRRNFEEINKQIMITGFIFMVFIILGTYINKFWPDAKSDILSNINPAIEYYKSDISVIDTVISNLKADVVFLGIISICTLLVITFPIIAIFFMLKGLSIGYTINSCILALKFKSIKMILIVLFKNFIIIPGAIILTLISLSYFKEMIYELKRKNRGNMLFLGKRYLLNAIIIIIVSVVLQLILNTISINIIKFLVK